MIQTNNPLLEFAEPGRSGAVGTDPTRSLPRFSDIRPEHVQPALEALLADNRAQREQLLSRGSRYTWDNLAQPLEDMSERLSRMWSPVSHLNSVMNNEALREVYNECLPKLSEYFTELAQDERIYTAYKEIKASPAYRGLSAAQKKIIDNTLRDFRLAGAELPAAKKARFKDVQMELSQLQSKYSENVLDATQAWDLMVIEEARLSGLPETARALAQQSAQSVGKPGWRFTLEFPSYLAIMTYADQRELRRQMYEAFVTRASDQGPHAGRWDNGPLMVQICKLRQEAAELLGFAHYAEYALQTRMAKTVPEVMDFLDLLAARSRPAARHDLEQLRRFAKEAHGVAELAPWDLAYYGEKLRQARYDISQEQVRPYLPDTRVLAGLFQ
ncbi:MAG: oligopeptidase A, partial [Pseudomonadota bacterium]